MSKLYKCPYEAAVKCNLELPCIGCETFAKFLKASGETPSISENEQVKEACVGCKWWNGNSCDHLAICWNRQEYKAR